MSWNNIIPVRMVSMYLSDAKECEDCHKYLTFYEWTQPENDYCIHCVDLKRKEQAEKEEAFAWDGEAQ